jgi:hypothetical protein
MLAWPLAPAPAGSMRSSSIWSVPFEDRGSLTDEHLAATCSPGPRRHGRCLVVAKHGPSGWRRLGGASPHLSASAQALLVRQCHCARPVSSAARQLVASAQERRFFAVYPRILAEDRGHRRLVGPATCRASSGVRRAGSTMMGNHPISSGRAARSMTQLARNRAVARSAEVSCASIAI